MAVAPRDLGTMTREKTIVARCSCRLNTGEDAAHLLHLPALPEDERQKRQATGLQPVHAELLSYTQSLPWLFLRLIEMAGPQQGEAQLKVKRSSFTWYILL